MLLHPTEWDRRSLFQMRIIPKHPQHVRIRRLARLPRLLRFPLLHLRPPPCNCEAGPYVVIMMGLAVHVHTQPT